MRAVLDVHGVNSRRIRSFPASAARCYCATHAIIGANLGAYRTTEWDGCESLLSRFSPNLLCLADRGVTGYAHWEAATATVAQLLWRCAVNRLLP